MSKTIIIGGGLSGLSVGWYLKKKRPDWELVILEAKERVGGKAWSVSEHGYLVERGINGVLDNKPATLDLARDLAVATLPSEDASRRRFIVKDGKLAQLPESAGAFLKSEILSPSGKLRLFMEAFIPKCEDEDESLSSFARRRLGEEAYRYMIDPMASGIFAGDPERLSVRNAFPRVWELEQTYGSLIKASISLMMEARKKGKGGGAKAGPGGVLTSFPGGMEDLVAALQAGLSNHIRTGAPAVGIEKSGENWQVEIAGGEVIEAENLVFSCPSYVAASLLKGISEKASRALSAIEYPPIAVVALGVKQEQMPADLNGFGFLCPGSEKRNILGCLWDSMVFQHRAPEGHHLLRCLLGGMRNRHIAKRSNSELEAMVVQELRDLMGLKGEPEYLHIFRWNAAIPQYHVGHHRLLHDIEQEFASMGRLYARCNWIGGVALNDCVAQSKMVAERISKKG